MESTTFDVLTQTFAIRHSRRGMTRLLGGLALGGPLALLGLSKAEAKCRKKCGPCKRCKKGKCKPRPAGTVCAGGTCQGGACVPTTPPPPPLICPSGTFALAGRCVPGCGEACTAKGGDCIQTFDLVQFCYPRAITSCTAVPTTCTSHADCGAQEFCTLTACGPNDTIANRCMPFLA